MKKAALRRVIIYVLVFSLTFSSVSAAVARPVEVQAVVGVDDAALAVLLALLAAGGYYASSKNAAANIKTEFLKFVGQISSLSSDSSDSKIDTIKSTVVYSGFLDQGYSETLAFEASKHFIAAMSLIELGYTDDSDRSWSVSKEDNRYLISDNIGNFYWSCSVPDFNNKVFPSDLKCDLYIQEAKLPDDGDPTAKAFAVGLLSELRKLVSSFLKYCFTKTQANAKVLKPKNSSDVFASNADSNLTLRNKLVNLFKDGKLSFTYSDDVLFALLNTPEDYFETALGDIFPSQYILYVTLSFFRLGLIFGYIFLKI